MIFFFQYTQKTPFSTHELPWITIFVTGEAIRQWFSRVTKSPAQIIAESLQGWRKIVIKDNESIMLFLIRYFVSWKHYSAKNNDRSLISPLSLRTVFSELELWRHHSLICDVIFVDCSFMRKLGQRRSSLVNNNREYRYLTTWYSWLSVYEVNQSLKVGRVPLHSCLWLVV